jgi:dTDP-4-dehydrorhamnose 3,5-epimerase
MTSREPKTTKGGVFGDDRGFIRFINDFDPYELKIRRFYQVENHRSGYVRAWHGHFNEGKYVYVAKGTALVAACRMIPDIPIVPSDKIELGDPQTVTLSSSVPSVLFIPPGFANGFKTLEEGTVILFYSTSTLEESKTDDIRFAWNKVDVWQEDFR